MIFSGHSAYRSLDKCILPDLTRPLAFLTTPSSPKPNHWTVFLFNIESPQICSLQPNSTLRFSTSLYPIMFGYLELISDSRPEFFLILSSCLLTFHHSFCSKSRFSHSGLLHLRGCCLPQHDCFQHRFHSWYAFFGFRGSFPHPTSHCITLSRNTGKETGVYSVP